MKTTVSLISLKISPCDVIHLLQIIDENMGNRKKIEDLTLEYYKKTSKNFASPHHSPFRVRVAHSLRKLRLLQGENTNVMLTPEGKHLYSISRNIASYKKELARMILQIDDEKCHILNIFQKITPEMNYKEIVQELEKSGIAVKKTDDKLRRWLQFLTYCEILFYDPPTYHFNSDMVKALKSNPQPVSMEEFKKKSLQGI